LYADDLADVPPIDQYDLLVIDECHRGYLMDREMSDAELIFRSQEDYISKYRGVEIPLEQFLDKCIKARYIQLTNTL
jgi:type I site-specific restriction endonuclease